MNVKNAEILLKKKKMEFQYEIYHENSKFHSLAIEIVESARLNRLIKRKYKSLPIAYPNMVKFDRNFSAKEGTKSSKKTKTKNNLSKEYIGFLLYNTYGCNNAPESPSSNRRGVGSIGNIYPLEIYLALNKGSDIMDGLYHYSVEHHALGYLKSFNENDLGNMGLNRKMDKSFCLMFITGIFSDISQIYGERCYRHILIETGKVIQYLDKQGRNFNFLLEELSFFKDYKCEDFLDIDGLDQSLLSVIYIGNA